MTAIAAFMALSFERVIYDQLPDDSLGGMCSPPSRQQQWQKKGKVVNANCQGHFIFMQLEIYNSVIQAAVAIIHQ